MLLALRTQWWLRSFSSSVSFSNWRFWMSFASASFSSIKLSASWIWTKDSFSQLFWSKRSCSIQHNGLNQCPEFNFVKRWLPPARGIAIVKIIWAYHNENVPWWRDFIFVYLSIFTLLNLSIFTFFFSRHFAAASLFLSLLCCLLSSSSFVNCWNRRFVVDFLSQ